MKMAGKRSIFDERLSGVRVITTAVAAAATDVSVLAAGHDYLRVLDVWFVTSSNSAGATTCQLKSGANAITDAIDINKATGTVTRAATISPTYDKVVPGTAIVATISAAANTGNLCVMIEPYTA